MKKLERRFRQAPLGGWQERLSTRLNRVHDVEFLVRFHFHRIIIFSRWVVMVSSLMASERLDHAFDMSATRRIIHPCVYVFARCL